MQGHRKVFHIGVANLIIGGGGVLNRIWLNDILDVSYYSFIWFILLSFIWWHCMKRSKILPNVCLFTFGDKMCFKITQITFNKRYFYACFSIIVFQLISLCCTSRPLPPLFRRPCLPNNVKQNTFESEQLVRKKPSEYHHLFLKI